MLKHEAKILTSKISPPLIRKTVHVYFIDKRGLRLDDSSRRRW
jgi:hypothetical protein